MKKVMAFLGALLVIYVAGSLTANAAYPTRRAEGIGSGYRVRPARRL